MENTQKTAGKNATENSFGVTEQLDEDRKFREEHIREQFSQLSNTDQHHVYMLVWSLGAKDLLYKLASRNEDDLRARVKELRGVN